jgi:hypothetical protein
MKPFTNTPDRGRGWAAAALLGALMLAAPTVAEAAMSKDQVAAKIVKVLRVEPATDNGKAIFAVTVMSGGGDWNHAFQVNTIAVDATTGQPVVQYRHGTSGSHNPPPFVGERTAPLTAEDQ